MATLIAVALAAYGLIALLFAALQTKLLYPAYAVPAAAPLPPGWQTLTATGADGTALVGVHAPPSRPADERLLLLVFPGNGWNAVDAAALVHQLVPRAHVVAFFYRGYRPSGGRASSAALLRDAPLVLSAAQAEVGPARTVLVGFSVGTGVAAATACRPGVDGAVLVTPFDSLTRVARMHYPWLPVRLLFRNEIDAAAALAQCRTPVAIIAAGEDRVIPAASTDGLRKAVPRLVFDRTIAGAGHNDLYARAEFADRLAQALSAVGEPRS